MEQLETADPDAVLSGRVGWLDADAPREHRVGVRRFELLHVPV